MSHELFVINRKAKLDGKEQDRATYLRDKLSTAESLGLKAQAASIRADIAAVERGRLITTAPLTDAELTIWRAWLPTAYTDLPNEQHHRLADYHFDRIPSPVLKLWQKHKESGAFERFEIWTPENQQPDPILVGVNGTIRHLLARWGESEANLVSFDDIKRTLVRRWHNGESIGDEPFDDFFARRERTMYACLAAIVVGAFTVIARTAVNISYLAGPPEVGMLIVGVTAAIAAVSTFVFVRRMITNKLLRSSALMQAIAKGDSVRREMLPASA